MAPHYAAHLRALDGVEPLWIISRDAGRVAALAAEAGVPGSGDDLGAALSDEAVDAVIVVNEPPRHLEAAWPALEAGKHLLIEKPLCLDASEAARFAKAAEKRPGQTVGVVAVKRFDPVMIEMHRRFTEQSKGQVMAQLTLMWSRDRAYYEMGTGWRKEHSPFFLNQGMHWIDAMLWFFGRPQRVQAHACVTRAYLACADMSSAVVEFDSGAVVSISGGSFCERTYPDSFTIFHGGGRLDYGEVLAEQRAAPGLGGRIKRKLAGGAPAGSGNPLAEQIAEFCRACMQGRQPATTARAGAAAVDLACRLSASGQD